MAQLVVSDLEDGVRDKLADLARSHGHSMEEEVRDILRGAVVGAVEDDDANFGTRLAGYFAGCGLTEEIPELRRQPIRPASFEP